MDAKFVVPQEPTYLKFWLCVERDPGFTPIPFFFYARFYKRLPEKCYFEDEAGTRFLVGLESCIFSGTLAFYRHTEILLSHYQQPWGVWVQCEFVDADNFDTFKIKVFNLDLVPIVPPEPMVYDTIAKSKAAYKYLQWFEDTVDPAGGLPSGQGGHKRRNLHRKGRCKAKANAKSANKYLHWFKFEGGRDATEGVGNGSSKFSTSSSPSSDDALPMTSDEEYFPEIVRNNNKATSGQRGRKKQRRDRK